MLTNLFIAVDCQVNFFFEYSFLLLVIDYVFMPACHWKNGVETKCSEITVKKYRTKYE